MIMFPCGMLFSIKQNYTVKLSLIGRNNSNKKIIPMNCRSPFI